jgi:hypothetical protein
MLQEQPSQSKIKNGKRDQQQPFLVGELLALVEVLPILSTQ